MKTSKKIPDHEIPSILERRAGGETLASIARTYRVVPLTIARICNGESRVNLTQGITDVAVDEFLAPGNAEEVKRLEALEEALKAQKDQKRPDAADRFMAFRRGDLDIDSIADLSAESIKQAAELIEQPGDKDK